LLEESIVHTRNSWSWGSTFIQLSHCLQTKSWKVRINS